jgi:hydroxymethylpyrimidine pyrophosphatase-like HAD family hydrolase
MLTPLQLISTDFDGTLHSDFTDPRVPDALQQKLATLQAEGATWLINTGRELDDLREGLALANLSVHPDFVVTVEREIYQCAGDDFRPLTDWNEQCAATQAELFATVADGLPELFAWANENFDARLYADAWSPFCFVARDNADADAIQQRVEQHFAGVPQLACVRNDVYARLSHTAFTKGTAMAEVARYLQIPRERIFAAGDHWNDLPMLQSDLAEWIVAPANAITEVIDHVARQGGFVSQAQTGLGVLEGLEWALAEAAPASTF